MYMYIVHILTVGPRLANDAAVLSLLSRLCRPTPPPASAPAGASRAGWCLARRRWPKGTCAGTCCNRQKRGWVVTSGLAFLLISIISRYRRYYY